MPHYIALIHKDADSCYGVSFPDAPGVYTAGDTIDETMQKATAVLAFAAQDWPRLHGKDFPAPRTIDELRADPAFVAKAANAVVAAVPIRGRAAAARPAPNHEALPNRLVAPIFGKSSATTERR